MKKDDTHLTRDLAPFGLRMQPDLKARIQAAAEANNRSMNAEIIATLEEKYPVPLDRGGWKIVYDYMDLIESAQTDAERAQFLASANKALQADTDLLHFEILVLPDPFHGGMFTTAISRKK